MMRGDEPAASTAAEAAAEVVEGGPRPKVVGGAIAGLLDGAVEAMLDPFGIYTAIRDSAGRIVDFQIGRAHV